MEYEEIERARRQKECNDDNDRQLQLHRMQRAKDREMLKQEVMQRNREMEEEDRKLAEGIVLVLILLKLSQMRI